MGGFGDLRRQRFSEMVSYPAGPALEIGPLAEPILRTAEHDVRYVDVFDQEGLREHYRDDPTIDSDAIPVIDFTLSTATGFQTLKEAVRAGGPYGYVAASHVVEHVPDVIGWLADVAALLRDDGVLLLVVPDRRYCFDYYRQQTSVGQMLQAAMAPDITPSVRAVYDHFRDATTVSAADAWHGVPPGELAECRIHDLATAETQAGRARAGEYVDCHVWTFTPETFVDQVHELGLLGMCDFTLEALLPTPENSLEFYVALRRVPRALDEPARKERMVTSAVKAREAAKRGPVPAGRGQGDIASLQARLRELDAEAQRLRVELAAVKRSERWRVGGILVGPPRWLLERVQPSTRSSD